MIKRRRGKEINVFENDFEIGFQSQDKNLKRKDNVIKVAIRIKANGCLNTDEILEIKTHTIIILQ